MPSKTVIHHGSTDIAALSAGVVAVAVSLFVSPGEFSILNLVVSITLALVILAYVWPHRRGVMQSAAVAAAMGLALLPAAGFLEEARQSRSPTAYLAGTYVWDCNVRDPCKGCEEGKPCSGEPRSRVQNQYLTLGWLLVLVLAFASDRFMQRNSPGDDEIEPASS